MTLSMTTFRMSLSMLIVLQLTMLFALYTQTPPHPPLTVPPFALGPFLGASLALAVAAMFPQNLDTPGTKALGVLAALCALVSFGPQKWLDPAIGQIWPAVLLGEIAAAILIIGVFGPSGRAAVPGEA